MILNIKPKSFQTVVLAVVFSVFISFVVEFVTKKYFRDYDYWINYLSVEAEEPVNYNDVPLWIISTFDAYKVSEVEWQDVLMCRPWGDSQRPFGRYSDFGSYAKSVKIGIQRVSRWKYDAELPSEDSECHLEKSVIVLVGDYIRHTQKLSSNTFRVRPRI